jgi:hypothetical protein
MNTVPDATGLPPPLWDLQDAQGAGIAAVQRAATDPGSSLQVLERVWAWCDNNEVYRKSPFRKLSVIRVNYMRAGLLPPTDRVFDAVSKTKALVFHGVVVGVELRLHFVHNKLKAIELPSRRCDIPSRACDLDLQAFDAKLWRRMLPYLVSFDYVWFRVALAVSRRAVRQRDLLDLLAAKSTTPEMARAALVLAAHRPGMHLFRDHVVWSAQSAWKLVCLMRPAPAIMWVMLGAQAPEPPVMSSGLFRMMMFGETVVAIQLLAEFSSMPTGLVWDIDEHVMAAWPWAGGCPADEHVVADKAVFNAVVDRQTAGWGPGRAAWATDAVCVARM